MAGVLWFRGSRGLNNRIDPLRVEFNPETGIQDLSVAYNVVHDYTGRISRRKGWEVTDIVSSCHSLFSIGPTALFVTGDALCLLGLDFTYSPLRNVATGARMDYARVGPRVYYANGHQTGMVIDGKSWSWVKPTEEYGPGTNKEFGQPPVGYLLEYYNGRMYVVQGNTIWYSEPFGTHLFDLARSFIPMDSEMTMIHAVRAGLFISTEFETFFVGGANPTEFVLQKVATYPAIRGTDVDVDVSKVGGLGLRGVGVMWASSEGICLGTPEGEFINLTESRLTYPRSLMGAGLFLGDRYVVTLEP